MFLKYNLANIKREKRLLKMSSCEIDSRDDNYFSLLINCDSPHDINVEDFIVYNCEIEECNDYVEARIKLIKDKILFKSKHKLSLNDKVIMCNKNKPSEQHEIIVRKIDLTISEGYIYTCYPKDKDNLPKKFNPYDFYDGNGKVLNVNQGTWDLVGDFDVVHVLHDSQILENGGKKFYKSGYYWLVNNEIVRITDNVEKIVSKFSSFKRINLLYDGFTKTSFKFNCKKYEEFNIDKTYNFTEYGLISLSREPSMIMKKGDIINIRKKKYLYRCERVLTEKDDFKTISFNPDGYSDYLGQERVSFMGNVYLWTLQGKNISCEVISERILKYSYDDEYFTENDVVEIKNNLLVDSYGALNKGVRFYEYNETIKLELPLSSENAIGLNDEMNIKSYFDEKKNELVPKIVDYEKKCFLPYHYEKNKGFNIVSKIRFNLFFRDRDENWNTNDTMGWFQYPMDNNGICSIKEPLTEGDSLCYLGFTNGDVYYRKKKLGKSFLRLSFYDTNNPFEQMLLFYSTIFVDTGDLYGELVNVNNETLDMDGLCDDNITINFSVYDRYNKQKSSEGFYLYMFPDGLDNGNERTIYMKVEFNHAGYGKTIPFIQPYDSDGKFMKFGDDNFPLSLMENGNLNKFYKYLYIPITIKYKSNSNEFVYYFTNISEYNRDCYDKDENSITINLYEPKINPLD